MNKKYFIIGGALLLLLFVAGALFFSGGGGNQNNNTGEVELVWWKTFEESGNVEELINDYQTLHKNVRINFVKKDASDYEAQLVNAMAAGNGPDIFSIHNDWLPKHLDKMAAAPDRAIPLRNYKDTFVDVAYSDFVKDEKIYAIPLFSDVLALYYNKDILGSAGISQPPATWPELISAVQKITKVSKPGTFSRSGIAMGTSINVNRSVDILTLMMLQNATKFYSDDFTSATFDQTQSFTDQDGRTSSFNPGAFALTVYTQFADPAKTSYTWNSKSEFSVDAFTQGKVAMMLSYQYMTPVIKAKAPNLNWDVAAVPQISLDVDKVNFANYWGEAVSKASAKQAVAWDFLNFISSRDELNKYYAKHKLVSSRKDILAQQASDTEIGTFALSALTARSVYKKDANIYEAVFLKMIDDVILNNFEAEQALRNGVRQINLDLQKQ